MLVQIEWDVINTIASFRSLDKLLMLFENEQHEWYLKEEVQLVFESSWVKNLSHSHQAIVKLIAQKSFVKSNNIPWTEKTRRGIVKISNDTKKGILLDDSLKFLQDPLLIVVENITSDKFFIKRLFEIYTSPGKRLMKALNSIFIDFYPSGGKNEMIKTLKSLSEKKPHPYLPRLLVIIDSDKKFPDQEYDTEIVKLVQYCSEKNISLHILYKREIENYIPEVVLRKKMPPVVYEVLEEFCQMNHDQKDFYDLEEGFKNKPVDINDPIFSNMAGRNNESYNKLRYGFHLAKQFIAKKELYKFVTDNDFNAGTVASRCAHQPDPNELVNLLKLIESKL